MNIDDLDDDEIRRMFGFSPPALVAADVFHDQPHWCVPTDRIEDQDVALMVDDEALVSLLDLQRELSAVRAAFHAAVDRCRDLDAELAKARRSNADLCQQLRALRGIDDVD